MKHISSYERFLFEESGSWLDSLLGKPSPDPQIKELVDSPSLLKLGSSGPGVKVVQRELGIPETGQYDESTKSKVKEFQKDPKNLDAAGARLRVDGIVGPRTKEAMFGVKLSQPEPVQIAAGGASPSLAGGFTVGGADGPLNLDRIAASSIDGRRSVSMAPGYGRGQAFGPKEEARYLRLASDPNVHWAVANCSSGQVVAKSSNAGSNLYGASVPKILIAAAALNNNGGRFSGAVLGSPEIEWKNLINLIVKSENNPPWTKVQQVAGGEAGVQRFCSQMGYTTMRPQRPTGQINALEMAKFYCDLVNGRFAGADALFKVSHAVATANSRSKVYVPVGTPMGGKTGTWSKYNHDTGWLHWGGQYWSIAVLTGGGFSNSDVAVLWGGLFRQWVSDQ